MWAVNHLARWRYYIACCKWLPPGCRTLPSGCCWLPSGCHQSAAGFHQATTRLYLASAATGCTWLPPGFDGCTCPSANRLHWLPPGCFCLLTGCKCCLPKQKCSKNAAYMQPMQQKCRLADKKPWSQNAASLKPTCSLFAANLHPRFLASKKMWVNMRWDLSYDSILSNVRKALIFGLIFT